METINGTTREKKLFEEFSRYAAKYIPFDWDTIKNDFRAEYKGKNDLIANYYRYFIVLTRVGALVKSAYSVIDFGVFPGVLPKVISEFYPKGVFKYYGVGLGFSNEFIAGMKDMGVNLLETELDPSYFSPKKVNAIPYRDLDIVLFLDVVEHLANPIHALDEANRCLKKEGHIIITTDNITNFWNFLSTIFGRSPLPPPILTNMFYMGDWRPHYREYAKDDLIWIIRNSGFEIVEHMYFDRRQGEYMVGDGKVIRKKEKEKHDDTGLNIFKLIRCKAGRLLGGLFFQLFNVFPHFRNHQIVVAKKVFEVEELKGRRPEPQCTTDGWRKIREQYLGY